MKKKPALPKVRITTSNGKKYVQVVLYQWDPDKKKSKTRILKTFGDFNPQHLLEASFYISRFQSIHHFKELALRYDVSMIDAFIAASAVFKSYPMLYSELNELVEEVFSDKDETHSR